MLHMMFLSTTCGSKVSQVARILRTAPTSDHPVPAGFHVTPHAYELATGWEAVYEEGVDGPCVGFCSEMDALPGIGHA